MGGRLKKTPQTVWWFQQQQTSFLMSPRRATFCVLNNPLKETKDQRNISKSKKIVNMFNLAFCFCSPRLGVRILPRLLPDSLLILCDLLNRRALHLPERHPKRRMCMHGKDVSVSLPKNQLSCPVFPPPWWRSCGRGVLDDRRLVVTLFHRRCAACLIRWSRQDVVCL